MSGGAIPMKDMIELVKSIENKKLKPYKGYLVMNDDGTMREIKDEQNEQSGSCTFDNWLDKL